MRKLTAPLSRWRSGFFWVACAIGVPSVLVSAHAAGAQSALTPAGWPWWLWPLAIFLFTSVLGVFTVLAGIGGAVVFVPLVSAMVPGLHLDFIRGAGLMIALAGALSALPTLLRMRLVDLRFAIPFSLSASIGAIFGAQWGLRLPTQIVQAALGATILAAAAILVLTRHSHASVGRAPDPLAVLLGIRSQVWDEATRTWTAWQPRHMALGFVLFAGVGVIGGFFGVGAGWANVPVLNLVMAVPFRTAVATSSFLLAGSASTAVWVYLTKGALLPIIVIPALLGVMGGARLGARLLSRTPPTLLRWIVIVALLLSGVRAALRGLGI